MVTILIMSAKMVTLSLLKIKLLWNNCYDAMIFVYDVINKILSRESNCIVDLVMWPKFGNSSISVREIISASIYKDLTRKNTFWRGDLGSIS